MKIYLFYYYKIHQHTVFLRVCLIKCRYRLKRICSATQIPQLLLFFLKLLQQIKFTLVSFKKLLNDLLIILMKIIIIIIAKEEIVIEALQILLFNNKINNKIKILNIK